MGLPAFLSAAWRIVSRLLGRSFRAWSEWAHDHPGDAADQLDLIARVLRRRSEAFRRQGGWRARRDRKISEALHEHARALRSREKKARACAVRPGTWRV